LSTNDIKNLSIALEALSRINAAEEPFNRVARLLDEALALKEEEHQQERDRRDLHKGRPDPNDDIPF